MIKGRKTLKAWVFFAIILSFFVAIVRPTGDTQAFFDPEVKQSSKGNWMQCYALQYAKATGGGTFMGGSEIGVVASSERVCAYVDDNGNMITGNVSIYSEPSGTITLKKDWGGNGNPKIYYEVKDDKHTIEFHQCTTDGAGTDCYSELAKTWTAEKGKNFKELAQEMNDFAHTNYNGAVKMALESNEDTGDLTQELSTIGGANTINAMCKQAKLKGLSWVACPVMDGAATTVSALDAMIAGWLEVDTDLYNSDSATYKVWDMMRNISNVAIVIVLLVIIFSQITGVGIDNYGIKKMLPRLLAMAVLLNLSFVACQLAIDVSNILGLSLNTMFRSIGASIMPDDAAIGNFLATAITSIFASVGIVGAIGGSVITIIGMVGTAGISAGFIVVLILLSLIPVLVAVLLFFIMLGARMVLVILCTAVAPVVAVLYILPNTQKWAKKWWGLFSAILVMYPLCGAIGGISYLIKAMVLSMDGVHFPMMVIGIIGPYLPFFVLPTLLKGSLRSLGAVGDSLISMGDKWRSGVKSGTEAVRDADVMKKRMDFAQERAAAARSQRLINRLNRKSGGDRSNLSAMDQDRLLKAEGVVNEDTQRSAMAAEGAFVVDPDTAKARAAALKASQETRAFQDQFANYSRDKLKNEVDVVVNWKEGDKPIWLDEAGRSQRMSALIGELGSRGMESDAFRLLQNQRVGNLFKDPDEDMSGVMTTMSNSSNRVLKAYGKIGNGVSYSEFMEGGKYRDNDTGEIVDSAYKLDKNGEKVIKDGKYVMNSEVSMRQYAENKGGEFVNGLEDKALAEIAKWDGEGSRPILDTAQLTQSAAVLRDESSMAQINAMLNNRHDIEGKISGEQLAQFNNSTLTMLEKKAQSEAAVGRAIVEASNAMMADAKLLASVNEANMRVINSIRHTSGEQSAGSGPKIELR